MVDFPQSLTALDYLRDLESRRRKEIAGSLKRIGLDESTLESPERLEELKNWNVSVADWVESLENKERKVEALYTNLYISLRRWVCDIIESALRYTANHRRYSSTKCASSRSTNTTAMPC